ncbi:heavy-metal-associated domain-containing protein [Maridesulfovibrio salexigens]|uniref:Heavy metal transport/detoxification protein n=1 Tax=Maridesulfovibrio salexigens (strain ATCC 14822 / DSM 2638 / NCIMB 8403 / VKM B-1763) TaxID=526222 RepID=C6BSE4_MARSD|nr:heavy metal-associated domain-containing protein [Maridesulfovibrio salexigens]ACS79620.1 Heavy metal transport/detoxification protein [Maridesulfovibrio salexigens DSM 2638]
MKKVEIKGMSCMHCVGSVEKALSAIEGVTDVKVSLEDACATYEESAPVDEAKIKETITKIGFEVGEVK